MTKVRLSAVVSTATNAQLKRYADSHGLKKGTLIEQALLHHLQALRELPADIIISPRVELSPASWAKVVELMKRPRQPIKALRELMAGKRSDDPD